MAGTPLQHCVDIRACSFGVADRYSCLPIQEEEPEGVFQLPGNYTPKLPWEDLLQGAGQESPADS